MKTRLEINLIADIRERTAMEFSGLMDVAKKLGEEVVELGEAIGCNRCTHNREGVIEEASDVAILAWDLLIKCGKNPMQEMSLKMDILEERKPYRMKSDIKVERV